MIDPRREAVLSRDHGAVEFEDKTLRVEHYAITAQGPVQITYAGERKYTYRPENVRILSDPTPVALEPGSKVDVNGVIWQNVVEVLAFTDRIDTYLRIFAQPPFGIEFHRLYPASKVRILGDVAQSPGVAGILRYWRDILARLPGDDPLQYPYSRMTFVHPDSVLGTYLAGAPISRRQLASTPIFPFSCNLSQRQAVESGLSRSISLIEGPPGTGKTETILNLIANIITAKAGSVAVVAATNAAVDNVREKLDELGFGHVIAALGKSEKRKLFFAMQEERNDRVKAFTENAPSAPPPNERMDEWDQQVRLLQEAERTRARLRQDIRAYRLEREHFLSHLEQSTAPDLERLPLLQKSSDRILDYLAESEVEFCGEKPGLIRRIRKYFKYGSLRGLDPVDTDVVLSLQRMYYDKRITELERELVEVEDQLHRGDFERLVREHREMSVQAFAAALASRYRLRPPGEFSLDSYRKGSTFAEFVHDYPLLLSTCHSLRESIGSGYLLDYLIIDEASQVDLLTAGLALSCCRNVVIVGDLKQLPPIPKQAAQKLDPPGPAFDVRVHSIISSLSALYGGDLPRTLLREHYRCDPAIIGFCNKAFYDGELIPFSSGGGQSPMIVVRTVEGNHMRQYAGGGRSNQREVDVIVNEVIPTYCRDVAQSDIGITTPYRRQVDKFADALIDDVESDTIHKFQGRQKKVVILTTVLDETWRGRTGLDFTDDPQKINVAVSRAIKRFILVTNHAMLPKSRTLRDLIGYIRYLRLDNEVVESEVVSVFDLLYRDFNRRLLPLASRLKGEMAYKSEDIAWTLLQEILAEGPHAHLTVRCQILLRSLLADLGRLTPEQHGYVQRRASVDFVVYNRVTNDPLLVIEVDGFAFHENNPRQLVRDQIKDEILREAHLPLLRLATTGSDEERLIRKALQQADGGLSRDPEADGLDQWPPGP